MNWFVTMQAGLFFILWVTAAVSAAPQGKPGCKTKCGNVSIPYPFGIGEGCYLEGFDVSCNTTIDPPVAVLGRNIDVLEFLTDDGLIRINQLIAKNCNYSTGGWSWSRTTMNIGGRPYKFTDQNRFVAIGCDTLAYLIDGIDGVTPPARFSTGCASICNDITYTQNRTCSGVGCCQTPLPKGLQSYHLRIDSYYNHTNCYDFSPCSFAFVADSNHFTNFTTSSFSDLISMKYYPVNLEWSIGNDTCPQKREDSACIAQNSYCYNPRNVAGYRCNCSEGYTGNPYLTDGCIDINECMSANLCAWKCINIPGKYKCSCPEYMDVDMDGHKCICSAGTERFGELTCKPIVNPPRSAKFSLIVVVIAGTVALIFLSANIAWSYWALKKKKLIKLKEKFFQQNGGSLLAKQMSHTDGASGMMKMFSSREITEATDNFSEYRVIGKGGFGTVYKGILSDGRVVAVKKSKISNEEQNEQFINEVLVLSNINHRNVVKLLGLCLETEVPLLIYEFILNGTLSEQIHDEGRQGSLSLESRLRIATEIAEALAYLHSSAAIPILHRDIKSSNILLDNNYVAKVSDFGMSRLVAFDQNCLNSIVRGTFGYLDPEYFQSGVFTEQSDVYSFGVVLVELLTGQKAVLLNRVPGNGNLAGYFISYYNENKTEEIYEDRVRDEGHKDQLLAVTEVAIRCLCVKRNERPTMKEVSKDLEEILFTKHPWTKKGEEEVEPLLMKPFPYDLESFSTSTTFCGESSNHSALPLNLMR